MTHTHYNANDYQVVDMSDDVEVIDYTDLPISDSDGMVDCETFSIRPINIDIGI